MPRKDNAVFFTEYGKLGTTESFSYVCWCTVEALAGFHVVQSSVSLLAADRVPVTFQMQYAHICVCRMIQIRLFSEVKESSLSPVLLKASS